MTGIIEQPDTPLLAKFLPKLVDGPLHMGLVGIFQGDHLKTQAAQSDRHGPRIVDRVAQWRALVARVADYQGQPLAAVPRRMALHPHPFGALLRQTFPRYRHQEGRGRKQGHPDDQGRPNPGHDFLL